MDSNISTQKKLQMCGNANQTLVMGVFIVLLLRKANLTHFRCEMSI